MDQELKAKWIAALRSGKYPQAKSVLRTKDEVNPAYCCLGVLCEVQGAVWGKFCDEDTYAEFIPLINDIPVGNPGEELLSPHFRAEIGLSDQSETMLAELNDGSGAKNITPRNFNQIADWIEANL